MGYNDWFETHAKKHKNIVNKLIAKNYDKEQIINYFDFDNMVKNEKEFCPLYEKNQKCHNMENLNCYLCACPNFRFNENGLATYDDFKILSKCKIHNGKEFANKGVIHQDCSTCKVPHHKAFINKVFDLDWKIIMKDCRIK